MPAGIRIDIHVTNYGTLVWEDPARLDRLSQLLGEAVEEAIYKHAQAEIHEEATAVLNRSIVSGAAFNDLGPAWSPEDGSQRGSTFPPRLEANDGLLPIRVYDDGARHFIIADFS